MLPVEKPFQFLYYLGAFDIIEHFSSQTAEDEELRQESVGFTSLFRIYLNICKEVVSMSNWSIF